MPSEQGRAVVRGVGGEYVLSDSTRPVDDLPVTEVPVRLLSLGSSPRTGGYVEENVRALAQLDVPWPPLLVHRPSYRVIDGAHRLLAARLRGDQTIAVRLYACDEVEAFILAVRANVTHGLPLSLSDRKAAAGRIVEDRPEWSDRRIALVAGLSDKTVAAVRARRGADEANPQGRRVGKDGRSRPVNLAAQRETVTRLLAEKPNSSLRQIAGLAGASPETVRKIRAGAPSGAAVAALTTAEQRNPERDVRRCLQILVGDPALRSTDTGKLLLRLLSTLRLIDQNSPSLVDAVPDHDLLLFRELAIANSEAWLSLASLAELRQSRSRGKTRRTRASA
jgi:hypothetical protein